jgi:putative transposase
MPRFARVVVPSYPYHVTHRGNRREDVFFSPEDRDVYRRWLREYAAECDLSVWAYCLMSNHVHLLVVPGSADALAATIGRTHMRYARWVNRRQGWSGHLWANRFYSTALDEAHLWAAVRYVESNPVRAGVVAAAQEYAWSSAQAHALGHSDALLSSERPFPDHGRVGDWATWLASGTDEEMVAAIRHNTATGRPTGAPAFIAHFEALVGRVLTAGRRGRKRKRPEAEK